MNSHQGNRRETEKKQLMKKQMEFSKFEMGKRKSDGNCNKSAVEGTAKRMAHEQRKTARLFAVNSTERGAWFSFSIQQNEDKRNEKVEQATKTIIEII